MELDASYLSDLSCVTMRQCTSTGFITSFRHPCRRGPGEDEDWLRDVANEMEIEDGGSIASEKAASRPFGIENLPDRAY